ncbi:MAG: vitamin transporter [Verrucomicrobiota bacterium]|jgi:vitamin B12 transporter
MWKDPRGWLLVMAALFSASPVARAQESTPTPTPGASEAEEIVVSATRIDTPADEIASSVTVITDDEIARNQQRTLPDVLQTVPGLNVVQTGGPGGQTSVFTRGTNSNHTKVIIDGIDVNDPSGNGAFDFGQVLTWDLSRVEVLRGPQSSLYGSDALGGVINLETKKGNGPPTFTGTLEGGSFDTFNQAGSASGSIGRFNYAVNVSHFLADSTPVTPLDLLPPGRKRNDDSYENTTFSTKLGYDFTDGFGVSGVVRYTNSDLLFTGDDFSVFPSVPAAEQSEQSEEQVFTRGEAHLSLFDGTFKNSAGLAYTYYDTETQAPDTGFGVPPPNVSRGDRLKFNWVGTIALTKNYTLLLGVEDQNDRLINSPISAENGNAAGFGELQTEIVHDLFVNGSVRYDSNDRFGGKTTWRVAPVYILPKLGTKLKATYGTGFKAPTLTDLFVSFPAFNFFANPNLRPEESEGYDVGFEQPLFDEHVRFGATYFHNDITNLIEDNATFTTLVNVGQATTQGVEAFVSYFLTDRFEVRADYTYTEATDDDTGLELLRRPQHRASLTASWRPSPKFLLSTTMVYVGSQVDGNRSFSITRFRTDPYYVANLAAEYEATKYLTIFARATNLFDEHYQTPTGFERPGLGFFAGVRVNFETKLASASTTEQANNIYAKDNSK